MSVKRIRSAPRAELQTRIRDLGFQFARMDDGRLYWDETWRFEITLAEVERDLEAPTNELWAMCRDFAARAVRDEACMIRLGIAALAMDTVAASWERGDPTLYGRFDLAWDGTGPAKLLELNADTPTSLYEAAVFQWTWLEDMRASGQLPADADQFNALHERLIDRWRAVARGPVHLCCMDNVEDRVTAEYVADCAGQAGLDPHLLLLRDLGVAEGRLVAPTGGRSAHEPIETLFKLYPWEWLWADAAGTPEMRKALRAGTRYLEPAWKALLSTKGLLAELWRAHPGHPNLLPAYHEGDATMPGIASDNYVVKPLLGREGANVTVRPTAGPLHQTGGPYRGRRIVQQFAENLFRTAEGHAIVGSWVIGDRASGVGFREDAGLITTNTARFIPHAIVD